MRKMSYWILMLCVGGVIAIGADDKVTLKMKNVPLESVVKLYEDLSGQAVIRQPGLPLGMACTLESQEMPKEEAVLAIEALFRSNGCFMVTKSEHVVVLGTFSVLQEFPPPLVTEVKNIPKGEQVIRFHMKLDHVSVTEVVKVLVPMKNPAAQIVASSDEKSLFITAPSSVVRSLLEVTSRIDKPRDLPNKTSEPSVAPAPQVQR